MNIELPDITTYRDRLYMVRAVDQYVEVEFITESLPGAWEQLTDEQKSHVLARYVTYKLTGEM